MQNDINSPIVTHSPSINIEIQSNPIALLFSLPFIRVASAYLIKTGTMKIVSASLALLFLPDSVLAAVGGRCSNNWGGDCICLDQNVCRDRWGGQPYTGSPGNWPCPWDPDNVMACVIRPCPGKGGNTQCLWSDACRSTSCGKCLYPARSVSLRCSMLTQWGQIQFAPVGTILSAATIGGASKSFAGLGTACLYDFARWFQIRGEKIVQ